METIQIDLGGGASIALPPEVANKLTQTLITRLLAQTKPSPYKIGEYVPGQGGIFAGDILGDDGVVYGLIVGQERDIGRAKWGVEDQTLSLSAWDGLTNTNTLVGLASPAARLASDYEADGHVDFYLPAKRELMIAAANLPHLFNADGWYWTSTPCGSYDAWVVDFEDGGVGTYYRTTEWRVRPVRRFTY